MSQENSRNQRAALAHASTALTAAAAEIVSMPEGEERSNRLRALATILVGSHEDLRAHAFYLCPDLEGVEPTPDEQLHASELEAVSKLKASDIWEIDRMLVASSTPSWQKATRVIGDTLVGLNNQFPGVSLGFYAQRVAALVQDGKLEAQGNLEFTRLCEIKLSSLSASAA